MAPLQLPQIGSATLADLLSSRYTPVQEILLKMLGTRDEARLKCVSKDIYKNIMVPRDWNNILEKFFSDAKAFRSFQAKINGILTGDIVIGFFAQTKHFLFDDPVLIFIVNQDDMNGAREFLENDGFVKDDNHSDEYSYHGINQVFEHPNQSTRAESRVKVHFCGGRQSPISTILMGIGHKAFDTTLSTDIVIWNKAYSVFPSLTFVHKLGYPLEYHTVYTVLSSNVGEWHRRIVAAGYTIMDISWYPVQNPSLTQRRRLGDKYSWVIDLPIHGVTASPVPNGAVASTTFGLTKIGLSQEDAIPGYLKEWESTISSPVLRHVYISQ
jgi:hypothetical protein